MDWDDLLKKMQAFDAVAKRMSAAPFDDFVARHDRLFDVAKLQLDGPIRALFERQQELEDMVQKLSAPQSDVAQRLLAVEEQWRSLVDQWSVGLPNELFAKLQVTLGGVEVTARGTVGSAPVTGAPGESSDVDSRSSHGLEVDDVLAQSRNVLRAARNRKQPLSDRIALLGLYLAFLSLVLAIVFQYQNDESAAQNTRAIVEAIRQTGAATANALDRLQQQADRKTVHQAVLLRPAPIRLAPSSRSPRLVDLPSRQIVIVMHHAGSWLFVEAALERGTTVSGWIHIQNLGLRFGH